jgi:alkanesulfonate monooxygenase SsuD/methylene tetrahydromethanopterin reductase-like flavin-dependent oxidoreductase (luciferase family)
MPPIRFDLVLPSSQLAWSDYLAAAQAADTMRYETFWGFDHLLPVWGDMDGPAFECYTTMAGIAAATKRIRVGTLVSGVAYRNPALQIKQATQVDVISGGRFDFGIGAGWAEREFKAFDIPYPEPKVRIGMLRETLDVAKLLWSGDPRKKVSYEGKYVKVTDIFLNPQPVQQPRPPILIGGGGEQLTLRVVARHADIWHAFGDHDTLRRKIGLIDEYARGYGRDPGEIVKSTNASVWVGDRIPDQALEKISSLNGRPIDQLRQSYIQGSPDAIEAKLRELIALGITYIIIVGGHPSLTDNWQRISDEIIPRFANG